MSAEQPDEATIFNAARQIESLDERAAFLTESCGDDAALRGRIEKLLAAFAEESQFLEQPAPGLADTMITGSTGENLAASLDAGLAPAFGEDAAVVIGNAGHSVLQSLGQTVDMPRVVLRESHAEGDGPIARPKSPEMPSGDSDSRYRLDGEIARGGMGAIIKGRDTDLGRDLAIKVLLDSHKDKPEVIQRFVEEAQIGGQLQHPGIAPIYELGQFKDKRPFFAMKLVKGQTLSKLLADRGDAADERGKFIGIFEQVCQTMAYAHSRGVIHRDLKPANIMVGAFGEVQVMDWGLAKVLQVGGVADEKKSQVLQKGQSIIQTMRSVGSDSPPGFGSAGSETQMGSVMGTPAYMPPEQALGEIDQMDERADVFGLGAILCEILTGSPPYVAEDGTHVFRMASRGKLEDCFERLDESGADSELITLTKQCLELEPKERPRNAGALAEGVAEHLETVETKLREAEIGQATQAARADAESRQAEAERQRAEAESQRAKSQSQAASRLRVIVACLAMVAVFAGATAVLFQRYGAKQIELAEQQNHARAATLVDGLLNAEIARVPGILEQIELDRKWVDPLLAAQRTEHAGVPQVQRRLALTLRSPPQDVETLREWLLAAEVDDLRVVRQVLNEQPELVRDSFWEVALDPQLPSEKRLRAACALATLDPNHANWQELGDFAAKQLLEQPLLLLDKWSDLLRPVHGQLLDQLAIAFRNSAEEQRVRREKATGLLAKQFDSQPEVLVNLLLDADAQQFEAILDPLQKNCDHAIRLLEAEINLEAEESISIEAREQHASRQANAAVALTRLDKTQKVWSLMRQTPRPDARSFLIHRLGPYGVNPQLVVDQLAGETDVSTRRALILSLNEFPEEAMKPFRAGLTADLLSRYRSDPDPGIHAAASWVLCKWGQRDQVRRFDQERKSMAPESANRWYVNGDLQTMVMLPPVTFARADGLENQTGLSHSVDRAFAIGCTLIPSNDGRWPIDANSRGVNWFTAAEYCNALSKREGIPPDQWCYETNPERGDLYWHEKIGIQYARLAPDYLSRSGYRMPTEVEWEYACRAGTVTSRFYGDSDRLLEHYAWCRSNSPRDSRNPMARLKPNDFGLFDMVGNTSQTCVGRITDQEPGALPRWDVEMSNLRVTHEDTQIKRGTDYNAPAARTTAAARGRMDEIYTGHGLRVVRTLPLDMCRAAFGEDHPATLGALYSEAILAFERGDQERVVALDQELLNHVTAAAGKNLERWRTALRFAARLAFRRRQFEIACQRCDELLADSPPDLSLAELRLASERHKTWTVLEPNEMRSEQGATLTLQSDLSVLASGQNPKNAEYAITAPAGPGTLAAFRLETLPHASLTGGGAGRGQLFGTIISKVTLAHVDSATGEEIPLRFVAGIADINGSKLLSRIPGMGDAFWSEVDASDVSQFTQPHELVFRLETPLVLTQATRIVVRIANQNKKYPEYNLGCFRLSVSDDPEVMKSEPKRWAFEKRNNPRERLAIAYALADLPDLAAENAARGFAVEDKHANRQSLLNHLSEFEGLPDAIQRLLLEERPRDQAGDRAVAKELAGAWADSLLTSSKQSEPWTVLKPIEMTSEGGATLTLQPDGSILASGMNPDQDVYEITAEIDGQGPLAFRLESVPHASLPHGGFGRSHNGNVCLSEFTVDVAGPGDSQDWQPIKIGQSMSNVDTDYAGQRATVQAVDGQNKTWWAAHHTTDESRLPMAIFNAAEPVAGEDRTRIRIRLTFASQYKNHAYGCFRLSVSDDPNACTKTEQRFATKKIDDPWAKLATVYHIVGAEEELRKLLTTRPEAAAGIGELHLLAKRWQQAIDVYDTVITQETTDVSLLSHRAQAHAALEQWELAKADWLRAVQEAPVLNREVFLAFRKANRVDDAAEFGLLAIEQKPDDLDLWVKLAPILLLAGNEDGYRKECVRMADQLAATTDDPWRTSTHCLACLLWPDAVDLSKLPQQTLVVPNEATLGAKELAEILAARALLAHRSGDFQAALDDIQKSQDYKPFSQIIALNLALQALSQHALGETEKAVITLKRASKQLASSQGYHKETGNLPYAAEVLLREAEATIGENQNSTDEAAGPATSKKAPAVERENKKVPETN